MQKNMGKTDKIIRWIIAVVFLVLFLTKTVTGALGIILLVMAVVLLAGTFLGICPLYIPLGINTNKPKE